LRGRKNKKTKNVFDNCELVSIYKALIPPCGVLDPDETGHVLTRLFVMYEQLLQNNPDNPIGKEAMNFFKNLDIALNQTEECNLNRR
jgi:hypothetical protein